MIRRRVIFALAVVVAVCLGQASETRAQSEGNVALEDNDIRLGIEIDADSREVWHSGNTTITSLKDPRLVRLQQGRIGMLAENMVIIDTITKDATHDVYIYGEDRVRYVGHTTTESRSSHVIRLQTIGSVTFRTKFESTTESPNGLMSRALQRVVPKTDSTTPVSLQVAQEPTFSPQVPQVAPIVVPSTRRIKVRPRSSTPFTLHSFVSRDTMPEEQVYVITGGVNVVVDGLSMPVGNTNVQPGVLDLSADRIVIWTEPNGRNSLSETSDLIQSANGQLQIYMEGNIVIRQAQNRITAQEAFFDAKNDRALMLNAELRAVLPQTGGEVRVRAARLRQLAENRFHAVNAWTTTSPYGKPGWRAQARELMIEPGPVSPFTELDPLTGRPKKGQPLWITSLDPQFLIGDTPVFWLPRLTAPAEDPQIPIRRAVVKHDRIFGLQIKTVWNLTKILGQPKQTGMQWDLIADYLTERGPTLGIQGNYDVASGIGRSIGNATAIWQLDHGADNLGFDRKSLPVDEHRGMLIWRHHEQLPGQAMLFGELGYVSDRNYVESFHENRFDTEKDAETIVGARQDLGSWSGSIFAQTELNEFEASTDWLPRADLHGLSQPVFGGLAYWSSHSSVGYADMEPNAPPNTLLDPFTSLALPYHNDATGLVAMTRHQIDAPFFLGALKLNPFIMGEAAFWDEGLLGDDVDRFTLSSGVQAQLSATKIMPFVRSDLWRLNGLAHKSDTFLEYRFTDVSRGLNEISQFNAIDDNSTERFRIRYTQQIFPGLIPNEFDPRNYAVRTGAGLWVSAPYHELVDDQQTLRLRWRNRLQTKVGPPGAERIRDWMVWETGFTWFPDGDRDNFGEDFGLIYGNYRWNINDRTSILADGVVDLFDNSQEVWSVGLLSQRSTRGSIYLGYRKVEARNFVDSQTLVASYSYQMSPKWISTGSIAYDVEAGESRGSSLTFSRVGLDWIVHVGFGIDTSKDNVGIAFALEPRFGPPSPTNLSYLLGLGR